MLRKTMNKNFLKFLCALTLIPSTIVAKTEVYFSPKGGCQEKVIKIIDQTKKTLEVAMYSLDNSQILLAIERAKTRGVEISIILDRTQAFNNVPETLNLKYKGVNVRIHSQNKIQHNKFSISDGKLAITGSFNWTNNAETSNEENCLFIDDPSIVKAFVERFENHLMIVNTESKSQKYLDRMEKKVDL